jgi:DNA-binding response OmpR family regulator
MKDKKTILVVEDDKFLVNIYRIKFTEKNFEVIVAMDGVEAINELQKKIPDIILLDLLMPKKDGFEVLTELKKKIEWKDIPVVVATNLGQSEDIKRALAMGANNYFVKSNVRIDEVVDTVMKTIPSSSV